MRLKGYLKRSAFAAMAAAALSVSIIAVAPTASGAATKASSSGGTATMALDENLAGFNINTSAASEFVLQEIMNMVWPQAFIVNNKLQPVLNNQLLESACVTSTGSEPQTVVYKINPKAVWSDGTPITADDFIYNWQAQSGNSAYTDVGGAALRRRVDRRLQPDRVRGGLRPVRRRRLRPGQHGQTATRACARTAAPSP